MDRVHEDGAREKRGDGVKEKKREEKSREREEGVRAAEQ